MAEKKKKLNIVIYAMSAWFEWEQGIVNRNRQVVEHLKKSKEVENILVINYIPFSPKRMLREFIKSKLWQKQENTVLHGFGYRVNRIEDNLYSLSTLSLRNLSKILKHLELENVIHWSFNPMNIEFLKNENTVFDAVDDWSVHPIYKKYIKKLEANYQQIAEKAGTVFTVSESLLELFKKNKNVHWIPNGVDVEHYQNPKQVEMSDLEHVEKPIIGYVGHIQSRFDIDLVEHLAKRNPHWNFVYIGSLWHEIQEEWNKKLGKHKNVYFLGPKAYSEIAAYINKFDVAILPHKVNAFTNSMNPMKIYEYLAAGKPVVSTNVAGVASFGELIFTAAYPEQFQRALEKALILSQNKGEEKRRVEFVKNHTWEKRINKMLEAIAEK